MSRCDIQAILKCVSVALTNIALVLLLHFCRDIIIIIIQTDGIGVAYTCYSIYAVTCKKPV